MTLHRVMLIAVAATLAAAPGTALAQDPGVVVDPETPTGKEYAIPLEQTRHEAAGDGRGTSAATGADRAPLFGEGVGPDGASAEAGRSSGRTPSGRRDGHDATGRTDRNEAPAGAPGAAVHDAAVHGAAAPQTTFSDAALVVGLGVSVLAIGGVLGVLGRRRRKSNS